MGKILKRCYICEWWGYYDQINIRRRTKDEKGYCYHDNAAPCNYSPPPSAINRFGDGKLYTYSECVCSAFQIELEHSREVAESNRVRDKKGNISFIVDKPETMTCNVCKKKVKKLINFDDGDDGEDMEYIEVCESCIKKASKKIRRLING